MQVPKIDGRTTEDLIQNIRSLAAAYTPEWRFDTEQPDVGTALAMIWAEMLQGTVSRAEQMPLLQQTAFLNAAGAKLLPAAPSAGYVVFGLADTLAAGVPVSRGTAVLADTDTEETSAIAFETVNDVLVTSATVQKIFCTDGADDRICSIYDANTPDSFVLFDRTSPNLQQHVFWIAQDAVLQLSHAARIALYFSPYQQNYLPRQTLEALADPHTALWEYETETGFYPFYQVQAEEQRLLLEKDDSHAAAAKMHFGQTRYWIRCTIRQIAPFANFVLDRITLSAQGKKLLPQAVYASGAQQEVHRCFPFGEKMSVYDEVYFACEEALCKAGAQISFDFNLHFVKIPIDLDLQDPTINWKLIMRRSAFQPDQTYDITITQVIWEYFNGQGWARLFPDAREEDCFSPARGTLGQFRQITFSCPADMTPILIGACESRYLRARILKIDNAYKTKGNYITPYIEEMRFSYTYQGSSVLPDAVCCQNALQQEQYERAALRDAQTAMRLVYPLTEQAPMTYFGFSQRLQSGPMKLLCRMAEEPTFALPRLTWQYWNGKEWKSLFLVDETEQFRKTGILTFLGAPDGQERNLFGVSAFWIRAVDTSGWYHTPQTFRPQVSGFFLNAVRVQSVSTQPEERFFMEPHAANFSCQVLHAKIQSVTVAVDELRETDAKELLVLEQAGKAHLVRNAAGNLEAAWVTWQETEDFAAWDAHARVYTVDRNQGVIQFGDGVHGRIPTYQDKETIAVTYTTGGGEITNLPPHQISRTAEAIRFVNTVTNPMITAGGCDQETLSQAIARSQAAFAHGYRAVTARDYEKLAMEAVRGLYQTRCFAGYAADGTRKAGAVTLVVLQKEYLRGREFFSQVKKQITAYLQERMSGNLVQLHRFAVVSPQFVTLRVQAEGVVSDFDAVFAVQQAMQNRLQRFLDPVSGNFSGEGWRIGTLPQIPQIMSCLQDTPQLQYITNLRVSASYQGQETDLQTPFPFGLPLSGSHTILLSIEERR